MIDTRKLGVHIERLGVAGVRHCVDSANRLDPTLNATFEPIAGGIVSFCGVDSPLSQGYGIGVAAGVTCDDVSAMTTFFAARGTKASVGVSTLADPALGEQLARAGYLPVDAENVLACELRAHGGQRDARVNVAQDLDAWADANARGFGATSTADPLFVHLAHIIGSAQGVILLELRVAGEIVATASMDVVDEWAGFFGGSTRLEHRGRGYHRALLLDRVARGCEGGATYGRAAAGPASASERNFRRCGFETLFTRTNWERPHGPNKE